jgi:DNA invertase Pin-like site-specific DNA recombinase
MTVYGYARVSTIGQTLAAQEATLHEAGAASSKRRSAARQAIALNSIGC